ncbi:conserved hypothetical protein [Xanthomonas citri pv. fuscans]|nr:conserved hypothetical protein [Xanthomonas citri pv. fuscans]
MGGKRPVGLVGTQSFQQAISTGDTAYSLFNKTISKLSGAVSSPIAGPLAAWMPPSSPHGRVYGVSRER